MKSLKKLQCSVEFQETLIERKKKVVALFKLMIEKGLDKLNCDNATLDNNQIAFTIINNSQLTTCRKFVKIFCPQWKDHITSIDNPCGDKVLIRYTPKGQYETGSVAPLIKIWRECTITTVPELPHANI